MVVRPVGAAPREGSSSGSDDPSVSQRTKGACPNAHRAHGVHRKVTSMRWELLRDVPEEDVARLLSTARRRRFAKGEVLFHEGDPATTFHLIDRGRVAVRVTTPGGEVATLDVLAAGDVVGELALLSPECERSATVVALEPVQTHSVGQSAFAALRQEHPSVEEVLVRLLAARVRRLNERLLEALYVPADRRVRRRLLELADIYGDEVPLTQDDLADLAGTTRATVNRILRQEERNGAVSLGRGKVGLLDRDALNRRSR